MDLAAVITVRVITSVVMTPVTPCRCYCSECQQGNYRYGFHSSPFLRGLDSQMTEGFHLGIFLSSPLTIRRSSLPFVTNENYLDEMARNRRTSQRVATLRVKNFDKSEAGKNSMTISSAQAKFYEENARATAIERLRLKGEEALRSENQSRSRSRLFRCSS
jgi:hypothetical protein